MPQRYCVLGFFYVTACWAENRSGHRIYRIRLEKRGLDELGWWAPEGTAQPPTPRDYDTKGLHRVCGSCGKDSVQVYKESWYCLDHECNPDGLLEDGARLTSFDYDEAFLKQRTPQDLAVTPPFDLIKEPPTKDPMIADFAAGRQAWMGLVCKNCGRCLSRENWDGWVCGANGCTWAWPMEHSVVSYRECISGPEYDGHAMPLDAWRDPVKELRCETNGQYFEHTFELLPGNTVTHLMANKHINGRPNGPNDLFHRLQQEKLGLQRIRMSSAASKSIHSQRFAC